jgi:class I fructose-bisphosphate aldolase
MSLAAIRDLLGADADALLSYKAKGFTTDKVVTPGPDFIDRVFSNTDRSPAVLKSFQALMNAGRLAGSGYVSILPVDQGIEHSAGASFSPEPMYFDPENIVKLAIEGGCNCVCSTFGGLAVVARKYAHKIPFMVKINHNEFITMPNKFDQVMFGSIKTAHEMGATAVGATIYWGSPEATRQLQEVAVAFEQAHQLGMVTVLWCYTRNPGFVDKEAKKDYHDSADLSAQANHLGVTIKADIVKQKLPTKNGGYLFTKHGKTMKPEKYAELMPQDNPIEMTRYQLANCYMGRIPLINSGGESKGGSDFAEAVRTAVVNKRAGGMGLISGRKAFQRPLKEGVKLLNLIQDVYLDKEVTIA